MRLTKTTNTKLLTQNYELYLFVIPAIIYFIIFHYGPILGVQIAFKDYIEVKGIWTSPWVGLKHFDRFIKSYSFKPVIFNTLLLSFYNIIFGFPVPIILALMLNQIRHQGYKKTIQNIIYAPHFISTVVMVGMLRVFLSPTSGLVNFFLKSINIEPIVFMGEARWFRFIYVSSEIWQHSGWESVIYLAALTSINPELYEAMMVDGANRFQRVLNIDIPGIMPVIAIMFILRIGQTMTISFEKVFLMQTATNLSASEVITTYIYKSGIEYVQHSYATAVGLFRSLINLALIFTANRIVKTFSESSLW